MLFAPVLMWTQGDTQIVPKFINDIILGKSFNKWFLHLQNKRFSLSGPFNF